MTQSLQTVALVRETKVITEMLRWSKVYTRSVLRTFSYCCPYINKLNWNDTFQQGHERKLLQTIWNTYCNFYWDTLFVLCFTSPSQCTPKRICISRKWFRAIYHIWCSNRSCLVYSSGFPGISMSRFHSIPPTWCPFCEFVANFTSFQAILKNETFRKCQGGYFCFFFTACIAVISYLPKLA